VLPNGGKRIFD